MTHILSKRDQSAAVRYALDRIDEALAQAWMREFCAANDILLHTLQDANNTPWAMKQRFQVATFLRSKQVKGRIVAKLMNRHYDMIRYYTKPALRERKRVKNCLNAKRWRGDGPQLSAAPL